MNVNLLSWSVAPHALRAGARLRLFREEPGRGADAAHLPPGYSAKLLSRIPVKNPGPSSLGALLGVRGLALVVVEDERPTRLPSESIDERDMRRRSFRLARQGFVLLVIGWTARQWRAQSATRLDD